ncbi:hypothetical protein N2152v2_007058 [Parachlorella kessleri]
MSSPTPDSRPGTASGPDSRPGTASSPVRPVTARTWQAINESASPKRVSLYTNDLYHQATSDDRPQSPQFRPSASRPVTPRSAERLQQQLVGSPNKAMMDQSRSPSRLQMSTANVPAVPPKAPQPALNDSLNSLLARAAKAVAEDEALQRQQQTASANTSGAGATPAAEGSGATVATVEALGSKAPSAESSGTANATTERPDAAPPAAEGSGTGSASVERPTTAPTSLSRLASARSAAISLTALQSPRPATPTSVLGAKDSPRAQQLFQNFASSSPAGNSTLPSTPRQPIGYNEAGNLGTPRGPAASQRPSTPSFQPVSINRPATAMADFGIMSGMNLSSKSLDGAKAANVGAPPAVSSLRQPYPVPPSTAPAKGNTREIARRNSLPGGLSTFGIMAGAFVAAPARNAASKAAQAAEEEELSDLSDPLRTAAMKAMLQADLLASADVGNKPGLRRFMLTPGPTDKTLQCKIFRSKSGFMKSQTQYVLVLEDGDQFLLAGQKRKSSTRGSDYTITMDRNDLTANGGNMCGKLRANFIGTEFVCYDDAEKPRSGVSNSARSELVGVTYQTNVLGTKGPRKMTVLIPKLDAYADKPIKMQPDSHRDGMLARYKCYDLQDMVVLRNKPPKWNDTLNAYCLNFGGRVTQASVKNFQLVSVDNMERIILQFGKVGPDVFTMDYAYPMTALQAFAICLSSFDSKLACE